MPIHVFSNMNCPVRNRKNLETGSQSTAQESLGKLSFARCRQRIANLLEPWFLVVSNYSGKGISNSTYRGTALLSVWIILFGLVVSAAEARTVRMVYIEAPPFYFTDEKGSPQGFLFALMKQVTKQAGYELEAFSYPAKRMAHKLLSGEADIWLGVSTIPGFKDQTLIGETEIVNVCLYLYYIGENKAIHGKEDFSDKSIIVLRGYSYGGLIQFIKDPANRVTYYETDSHESAFRMLKAGRADYLLDYKTPTERTLKTVKIPELKSVELSSVPLKFVVSKKVPDAPRLLKALEDAYRELVQSGEIKPY